MMSVEEIRNAIEKTTAQRAAIYSALARAGMGGDPDLAEEGRELDYALIALWEDLRLARCRSSVFCFDCGESMDHERALVHPRSHTMTTQRQPASKVVGHARNKLDRNSMGAAGL